MKKLIERFSNLVKGSITGFDRIVFKGFILPLMAAKGAMNFCRTNGILNKDYKKWMMQQTVCIVETMDQYAKENCGQGIIAIPTWRIRKEDLAHQRQQDERIENGLIGVSKNEQKWGRLCSYAFLSSNSTQSSLAMLLSSYFVV
jgi:hypothetical protein